MILSVKDMLNIRENHIPNYRVDDIAFTCMYPDSQKGLKERVRREMFHALSERLADLYGFLPLGTDVSVSWEFIDELRMYEAKMKWWPNHTKARIMSMGDNVWEVQRLPSQMLGEKLTLLATPDYRALTEASFPYDDVIPYREVDYWVVGYDTRRRHWLFDDVAPASWPKVDLPLSS